MLEHDIENVQYELVVDAAPAAAPSNPILDSMHWNEDLTAVLQRDPTLLQTAWTSFFVVRAPGTVKCYTNLTMKFQQFSADHTLDFPLYTSDTLLQFILHHIKNHALFSFLASIKPALTLLDAATHCPSPFNKYIDTILVSAAPPAAPFGRPPLFHWSKSNWYWILMLHLIWPILSSFRLSTSAQRSASW
jgi:hypothetical protein